MATLTLDLMGFTSDTEVEYRFNPIVDFLPDETILVEFYSALDTFFKWVKRLFSIGAIDAVHESVRSMVQRDERSLFVNPNGVIREILIRMFDLLMGAENAGPLMEITKGEAALLFNLGGQWNVLKFTPNTDAPPEVPLNVSKQKSVVHFKSFVEYLRRRNERTTRFELHAMLLNLSLGTVLLSQLEQVIFAKGVADFARVGVFPPKEFFNVKRALANVSFTREGLLEYVDELRSSSGTIEESIFMRQLLSKSWVPEIREIEFEIRDADVLTVELPAHSSRTMVTVNFWERIFSNHGVFFRRNRRIGSGSNGATFLGCVPRQMASSSDDDGAAMEGCGTVVKISRFDKNEVVAQKIATKRGLAPLFTSRYFAVSELTRSEEGEWSNSEAWWMVIPMERLDKTLGEVIDEGSLTREDVTAIAELLERFASFAFVHHDLKTDNLMCKEMEGHERRWYIIDYGTAWCGGYNYNPQSSEYIPMNNIPYGYDIEFGAVFPKVMYLGWTQLKFNTPPVNFDIACLIASLHFKITSNWRKARLMFFNQFRREISDSMVIESGSISYRPSRTSKYQRLFAITVK